MSGPPSSRFHRALLPALAVGLLVSLPAPAVVSDVAESPPQPGGDTQGAVFVSWYQGSWNRLDDIDRTNRIGYGLTSGFSLDEVPLEREFAAIYEGFIDIPEAGDYRFYTRSDDGSALYIDGERVVDNDGLHGMRTRWGQVSLEAGSHEIRVEFFQKHGGQGLEVGYEGPEGVRTGIDPALLSYDPGVIPEPREPDVQEGAVFAGLAYEYFEGDLHSLDDLKALDAPLFEGQTPDFNLDERISDSRFGFRFQGFIEVPEDGIYRFYTASDDGSELYIGDTLVVDNGGQHPLRERGGAIHLSAGLHRVTVHFFQRWGEDVLTVSWAGPGFEKTSIPAGALSHTLDMLPPHRAPDTPAGPLQAGLAYRYYEGSWRSLDDFAGFDPAAETLPEPLAVGVSAGFDLGEALDDNRFGMSFTGYLTIPEGEGGIYRFFTTSDDGSRLTIGDQRVVDNDGTHGPRTAFGSIALQPGTHLIRVDYFEHWGGEQLSVEYQPPGGVRTEIPLDRLSHTAAQLPSLLPALAAPAGLREGLAYAYREGKWRSLDEMLADGEPVSHGVVSGVSLEPRLGDDRYGFVYQGYIDLPEDGFYRFFTRSDDGSRLFVDDTLVVDNDGLHGMREVVGSLGLAAGLHRIRIEFFDRYGDDGLVVGYRSPTGVTAALDPAALYHTADLLPGLMPAVIASDLAPGLAYEYAEGKFSDYVDFDAVAADAHGVAPVIGLDAARRDHRFALRLRGFLRIHEDGFHLMHLTSGGRTRVSLAGQPLVETDGKRSWETQVGAIGLEAGLHPIVVEYYQDWGGKPLTLELTGPSGERTVISEHDLSYGADQLPALIAGVAEQPAGSRSGLAYIYHEGDWRKLADFDAHAAANAPVGLGVVSNFSLEPAADDNRYGFSFQGYVQVPVDGFVDFYTNSDDGSRLLIDGQLVVDNDGQHGARDAAGNIGLAAGWHRIQVDYFERWGDESLAVSWRLPGGERMPIPDASLVYDPSVLPTLEAADAARDHLIGGIEYEYFEGKWKQLPDFDTLTPVATGVVDGFTLAPRQRDDLFAFRFRGYIDIPEYGFYTFYTTSDDGSRLYIGDQLVVDNDGLHAARERSGRIALERGRHAITVTVFERYGEEVLEVAYSGPRFDKEPIGPTVLFRLDPARNGDPGDPGAPEGPTDPATNQSPTPGADTAVTGIGAGQVLSVDVLANDSDPDGDILHLAACGSGSGLGATLVDWATGELLYVPPLGFVGTDTVTYSVTDRRGGTAEGTLTVQVGDPGATLAMTAGEAADFLTQASFGPTKGDIALLMEQGPEAWIDAQLAMAPSLHADALALVDGGDSSNRELRVRAWLHHAVTAPDQLRQRVAFALSQILVVSDLGTDLATEDGALGAVDYYDLLVRDAFGDYRTLLADVTLHPAMGLYLNMAGNVKADPVLGTIPDENYAREILQLFAVGLWQLNPDGTRVLDADGQPLESYSEDDVKELAKVFTGWDFAVDSGPDKFRLPMVLDPAEHEDGPKLLLGGELVPADQGADADLAQALDNIMAQPSVAPFISRQLIQRLVTSNPSAAYVERVSAVFRGSAGDLGQVVKAILLDPEARSGTPDPLDALAEADPDFVPPGPAFGKLREPLLQLTALWRALGVEPQALRIRLAELAPLGQTPLSAPSVFNFFKPDYQDPGLITELGLYSPELEIVNEKQVINAASVMDDWTLGGEEHYDLTMERAFANSDPEKLLDHLDLLFLGGHMSDAMRLTLRDEVLDFEGGSCSGDARLQRALAAVYLIVTSPEFLTQSIRTQAR